MDQNTQGGIDPKRLIEQDLFDAVGMSNMSDDQKVNIMTSLSEAVNNRVLIMVHDLLPEADRQAWTDVVNTGTEKQMNEFLNARNISLDKITVEAALGLKAQFIEMADKLKSAN
jgi:hypothetical protein